MKIIQLIYSLQQGGAERFVVELANELIKFNNEVLLCVFRDDSRDKNLSFNKRFLNDNVGYVNLKIPNGFHLNTYKIIDDLIDSYNPDIVHCHLNVIPYLFKAALLNRKIKIFHTLHNIASKTVSSKIQYYVNRFFYTNRIIIPITISKECSHSYRDFYKNNYDIMIENGSIEVTPTSLFSTVKDEINSYRNNLDTKIFIHVARFNPSKNQKMLVEAFVLLSKMYFDFILIIIGDGFDKNEAKELIGIANEKIKFLGVKYNVGDYLLCSDVFCLTSIYEGLPISLLEALSCGCIPICTPVGGIKDVIIDGENGYLSEDISRNSYLNKLEFFMENSKAIKTNKLKKYFIDNYSMNICTRNYLRLYESVGK